MTFNANDHLSLIYILDGKTPIACKDCLAWVKWMQTTNRYVAEDWVNDYWIATIFDGMDDNFPIGPPMLFQTNVWYRPNKGDLWTEGTERLEDYAKHYSTWNEAELGHQATVKLIRKLSLKVIEK